MHKGQHRVRYLDGLRGLAILLVVGWHFIGPTYSAYLPYGDTLGWLPAFNRGWIGVYLFFLISGYVIFMTLERCSGFGDFMMRRWLRLFPAMLMVSLAVFALSQYWASHMPSGKASPIDLLPGLTFINPAFYHVLLHDGVHSLDGVFWTLYVEAGFYVFIGILFFWLGWRSSIVVLIGVWIVMLLARPVIDWLPRTPLSRAIEPFEWLGVNHYGWFASGILFLKARELRSDRLFVLALAVGIASAVTFRAAIPTDPVSRVCLGGCALLFAAAQRWQGLQRLLETRVALFLGFVSYPLYLIHTEMGIGAMGAAAPVLPRSTWPLLPLLTGALVIFLAWIVARWIEPGVAGFFRRRLRRSSASAEAGR